MTNVFDIRTYGAVGDGVTDDTEAIRAAFADAAKCGGTVEVPPGRYITGRLKMETGMRLEGRAAWGLKEFGGSEFILREGEEDCMIDITGAIGATIVGMSLNGMRRGRRVHGVKLYWEKYNGGGTEDMPVIENCRIAHFTGDGIHLEHVWCYYVRHCMLHSNRGSGLYMDGWDALIHDNWIGGNLEYGICAAPTGASGTITENRIVWSRIAGIRMDRAGSWNITGCFFDRAFGPAIWLGHDGRANDITISGNMIRRSGKPRQTPFDSPFESSQILIEKGSNISVNGNTFAVGRDDGGKGTFSPDYGIVMRECTDCVISANALQKGSLKQNIVLDSCRDVELLGNVGRSVEEDAQK